MLNQPLTNLDFLKHFLEEQGLAPAKSMGQNFLISPEVVEAILQTISGGPQQITELGPGVGSVTQGLIAHGYAVRAIEKDDDFAELLPSVVEAKKRNNLEIIHGDLKDEAWDWPTPYQLVGNIPYNLSGLILRRLTQLTNPPTQAVFLVQKEVGQRLKAAPPDMNLLSLAVALWGKGQKILNVPPSCFWPRPKVYSQLVLLTTTANNPLSLEQREKVISVAKVFFQQKRKQVGGVLRKQFGISASAQQTLLEDLGIAPTARPQELNKEAWIKLADRLR